jgi:hypothetical protein
MALAEVLGKVATAAAIDLEEQIASAKSKKSRSAVELTEREIISDRK